jgi:hypothetical protein
LRRDVRGVRPVHELVSPPTPHCTNDDTPQILEALPSAKCVSFDIDSPSGSCSFSNLGNMFLQLSHIV